MARAFIITVETPDGVEREAGRWGDSSMTDEQLESYRDDVMKRARSLEYRVRVYSPGDNDDPPTEEDLTWDCTINN